MSAHSPQDRERLLELLADERLDQLAPEDRAELEALRARVGAGEEMGQLFGELLMLADREDARRSGGTEGMPAALRARLRHVGENLVGARGGTHRLRPRRLPWGMMAAALLVAGGAVGIAVKVARDHRVELASARAELAALEARSRENETVLASARARVDELMREITAGGVRFDEQRRELAALAAREVALAAQLAAATSDLDAARTEIARFEAPVDPATLQQDRRKLLEVPGTIRVAWSPFDLPDAPAEQREVSGDVVWNDELEKGYLRFVGLKVNDPGVEQYQVWIIDERGMEQKISGGVFNATADGEVIVPLDPAIDVRRVALFAVTVEEPGGTWVPDLRRRVVVAPRGEG